MTAKIDSHQHFWLYNAEDYGWMAGDRSPLQVDYMPPDLQPLLESSGIDGTVAVQARQVLAETEFLLELADQYDLIRGVVGWVDMRAGDVEAQLERFAPHPRLVGRSPYCARRSGRPLHARRQLPARLGGAQSLRPAL